jgi:hypothetical protein
VDSLPDGIDDVWNRIEPHIAYGIAKPQDWWDWRFRKPGGRYGFYSVKSGSGLAGAAATLERTSESGVEAAILEFLAVDEDAARALVTEIADDGPVAIAAMGVPGSHYADMLTAASRGPSSARTEPAERARVGHVSSHRRDADDVERCVVRVRSPVMVRSG